VLHNAAYRELGLDWVYVPFHVRGGEAPAALDAMRALDLAGLSVTMPHKTTVADACDELTETAAVLRSVNTVTPVGEGRLRGDSTDGEGFMRALADRDIDAAGKRALILGAGGAARAVAYALREAGATIAVCARRAEPAAAMAALVDGSVVEWDQRNAAAADADLLVNATPLDPSPFAPGTITARHAVADLVYSYFDTALTHEAVSVGAKYMDGQSMLLHQAALQIEQWTGLAAPIEAMFRALPAQ
jgi:shikimate dehydrogenase